MSGLISNYLAITALGVNKPSVISKFIQIISNCGCNILNTKITTFGSEFACCLFVSGNWGTIAKSEVALSNMEKELGITTSVRRTTPNNADANKIPYIINLVTIDRTGLLQEIITFFSKQAIAIEDIATNVYYAPNNTKMANITVNINIDGTTNIATLREKFMTYCDNLNLDASIEPLRCY